MIKNIYTRGSLFWSRKVFEGAHSHVMGLLRKSDIGPLNFLFEMYDKKWTKIGFSKQANHVRMNSFKHFSGPKRDPRVVSHGKLSLKSH